MAGAYPEAVVDPACSTYLSYKAPAENSVDMGGTGGGADKGAAASLDLDFFDFELFFDFLSLLEAAVIQK